MLHCHTNSTESYSSCDIAVWMYQTFHRFCHKCMLLLGGKTALLLMSTCMVKWLCTMCMVSLMGDAGCHMSLPMVFRHAVHSRNMCRLDCVVFVDSYYYLLSEYCRMFLTESLSSLKIARAHDGCDDGLIGSLDEQCLTGDSLHDLYSLRVNSIQ